MAASLQPGANVSAVARSEGLDPSQLYGWRRKALASGVVSPVTAGAHSPARFARVEIASGGLIDVVVGDMVVRVGSAFDPDHLVNVLRAVRKA
ncbi:transposase [Pseudochrobactrum kiredjianiae]|uniref:Transposase n=1 Tax=Pseudochrobactrum kiredjianiae TaxID=386305 RepID=A0ABW3V1L8_9HYPH|nr:transposase [Pseudochrobactrum kiredjianiae]MDM7853214.1 transposase [Pseudochrobactrum kiredjianiae]MDM7853221.1 transposase [Pseudochrobactrum kiredjianiae]